MSNPASYAEAGILRQLLERRPGVRFVDTGKEWAYREFRADLSQCMALAGADALTYLEPLTPPSPLEERVAALRELASLRFAHGRILVADVDARALAREAGLTSDEQQIVFIDPCQLTAADTATAITLVRERFRSGVPLETLVLYKSQGAVTGHRFFGRANQIEAILKKPQEAYLVTSTRMSGKSSLLLETYMRMQAHRMQNPSPEAVYLDLKGYFDFQTVISAILRALNIRESVSHSEKWPANRWPEFFRRLRAYAKQLPTKRLTLFIDEFDRAVVLDDAAGGTIIWGMRTLHQDNSPTQGYVQFVIAGSKRLAKLANNLDSPLHNFVNTEDCRLTNFNLGTIQQMVTGPVESLGINVPAPLAVAQEILHKTAGRPSSVQYLCERAVKSLIAQDKKTFTPDTVQAVVDSGEYMQYYQRQVFENTDALDQCILCMNAKVERFSDEDIHNVLREEHNVAVDQAAVFDSIVDLEHSGFLTASDRGGGLRYEIATPVVRKIFKDHKVRRYVDQMLQKQLAVPMR